MEIQVERAGNLIFEYLNPFFALMQSIIGENVFHPVLRSHSAPIRLIFRKRDVNRPNDPTPYSSNNPDILAENLNCSLSCYRCKLPTPTANIPLSLHAFRYRCRHPTITANIPLSLQTSHFRCKYPAIAATSRYCCNLDEC